MLTLPLPFCLFKFLKFPFDIPDFKSEWTACQPNLLTTEPLKLNIELIRNYEDLLTVFPNAQFLNKQPQNPVTKWGIWAILFDRLKFMIRLVFFEKYVAVIQISGREDNSGLVRRIKEEILANLEFILCE